MIDLQRARSPRIADARRQRRRDVEDEALEPFARRALEQLEAEIVVARPRAAAHQPVELGVRRVLPDARILRQLLQHVDRLREHLARPVSGVEQALDQPQLRHLLLRIQPFAARRAHRLREAVAPLPDPQRVLRQPDLVGNRADADARERHDSVVRVAGVGQRLSSVI